MEFPHDILTERMPIASGENVALVKITLTEKITRRLKTDKYECNNYRDQSEFNECGKIQMWKLLRPTINCTIVGLEKITPNISDFSQCKTLAEATQTYQKMETAFTSFMSNLTR